MQIDIRIGHNIIDRPITNHEKACILLGLVDEAMRISCAGRKSNTRSGRDDLLAFIGLQNEFSFCHIDKLVLLGMSMATRLLSAWREPHDVDAKVRHSAEVPDAAHVAVLHDGFEGIGIATSSRLLHIDGTKHL